ncbi:hydroxyethylthiazole kinase [Sporosarcina sp. FSL K6-3457]|uniref:hydroxyethylthiazole kinase n=1 Tax=Sporosarcina sp. FSL K6-3457 TaxID=2978204 RepID=UPI0030F6E276
MIQKLRTDQPLVHCITNIVVANFQANGLLALGASPVMADAVEEAADIASIASCTVLNIGTLKRETVKAMLLAGKSANQHGKPVVLDPVGAGATAFRKESVLGILHEVDVTLIRCNAGELATIAGVKWQAKGVDAGQGDADLATLAEEVARRHHCIVAVTGAVDIVTDGNKTLHITGGHPLMAKITGSGCLLSAVAGAFLAVANEKQLDAVVSACTFYKQAGQLAAEKSEGLGDFQVQFLNALGGETR